MNAKASFKVPIVQMNTKEMNIPEINMFVSLFFGQEKVINYSDNYGVVWLVAGIASYLCCVYYDINLQV